MSGKVSKEKYQKAKTVMNQWIDQATQLKKENDQLHLEVERWKKLSDVLPDPATVDDLENKIQRYSSMVKTLNKQNSELEDKYRDRVAQLERENLLLQGRVQQLEEGRKDLQERYNELRQDMREQRLYIKTNP